KKTEITFNTISIPRGGHYKLSLPDGTNVHLNSESSLTYPTRFTGDKREVQLEGEAFFEVEKRENQEGKNISFIIQTLTQKVEVLGTVFNINAYNGNPVKTTLTEGKVRVTSLSGHSVVLKPGEAAL